MCYKGKCLYCLEVETGALIFAILNVIVNSFGTVGSVAFLVYANVMYREAVDRASQDMNEQMMAGAIVAGLTVNVIIATLFVIFSINFAFAVVLIVGLCKRNAAYVKTYFIFGMVKVVMMVIAVIVTMVIGLGAPQHLVIIFANAVLIMILVMIRMTYKKFENEVAYKSFPEPISIVGKF